jgi:hypothetical protein
LGRSSPQRGAYWRTQARIGDMLPRELCGALQGSEIPRHSLSWMRGCASGSYSTTSPSRVCKKKCQSWERVQRRGAPAHRAENQANFSRHGACHAQRARKPRLGHACMRDLRWSATLARNPHVGREVRPGPTATMFTDASMRGWGAVWNGKVPESGLFDAANEGSSIN